MDIINPEVYFILYFANQYALLRTSNAYRNMPMRILTPCLFFQIKCVFTKFQCVITLLRALSVALYELLCPQRRMSVYTVVLYSLVFQVL